MHPEFATNFSRMTSTHIPGQLTEATTFGEINLETAQTWSETLPAMSTEQVIWILPILLNAALSTGYDNALFQNLTNYRHRLSTPESRRKVASQATSFNRNQREAISNMLGECLTRSIPHDHISLQISAPLLILRALISGATTNLTDREDANTIKLN